MDTGGEGNNNNNKENKTHHCFLNLHICSWEREQMALKKVWRPRVAKFLDAEGEGAAVAS